MLPEQYMAQATYEIYNTPNTPNTIVDSTIIQEYIKNYQNVTVTLNNNDKKYITIKTYGKSQKEAKDYLKELTNIELTKGFEDTIANTKIKLEEKLKSINETMSLYQKLKNPIIDPSSINNLMYEKKEIMLWLQKPYILKQTSNITVSSKPVKPRKLLIIAVAFVSGLFMSLFIVLFIDAYESWKKSRKENA